MRRCWWRWWENEEKGLRNWGDPNDWEELGMSTRCPCRPHPECSLPHLPVPSISSFRKEQKKKVKNSRLALGYFWLDIPREFLFSVTFITYVKATKCFPYTRTHRHTHHLKLANGWSNLVLGEWCSISPTPISTHQHIDIQQLSYAEGLHLVWGRACQEWWSGLRQCNSDPVPVPPWPSKARSPKSFWWVWCSK